MLKPQSPRKTTFKSSSFPFFSKTVSISAMVWHGWNFSLKPLIIGIFETEAIFSKSLCLFTLAITTSQYLSIVFIVSSIVSPLPSWVVRISRYIACPPNCVIPTSKETLVLVEDFSNNIAKVWFSSFSSISSAFTFKARSRICFISFSE